MEEIISLEKIQIGLEGPKIVPLMQQEAKLSRALEANWNRVDRTGRNRVVRVNQNKVVRADSKCHRVYIKDHLLFVLLAQVSRVSSVGVVASTVSMELSREKL